MEPVNFFVLIGGPLSAIFFRLAAAWIEGGKINLINRAYPFESGGSIYCVVQDTVRSWNSCAAHVERAIWLGM